MPDASRWLDRGTYINESGQERLTESAGAARFRLPGTTIRYYRERIHHEKVRPPVVTRWPTEFVYAVNDSTEGRISLLDFAAQYHARRGLDRKDELMKLAGFKEAYAAARQKLQRGITPKQITERFDINGKNFCDAWANKNSILHPREPALRRLDGFVFARVYKPYSAEDVSNILRGRESSHPRTGKPATPRPGALSDVQAQLEMEKKLRADGPLTTEVVRRFARETMISGRQLKQIAVNLQVDFVQVGGGAHKDCYWCLPGQQVPPEVRLAHAPATLKAAEFLLRELRDRNEHAIQGLIELASKRGIKERRLYNARPYLDIEANREPHGEVSHGQPPVRYGTWRLVEGERTKAARRVLQLPAQTPANSPDSRTDGNGQPSATAPGGPLDGAANRQDGTRLPVLSAQEHDFLDGLFEFKAFSSATRATVDEVANRRQLNTGTLGRTAVGLKEKGLVDSARGREGGYWLTPGGKVVVERARQ